jgi:hypothetical protein
VAGEPRSKDAAEWERAQFTSGQKIFVAPVSRRRFFCFLHRAKTPARRRRDKPLSRAPCRDRCKTQILDTSHPSRVTRYDEFTQAKRFLDHSICGKLCDRGFARGMAKADCFLRVSNETREGQ